MTRKPLTKMIGLIALIALAWALPFAGADTNTVTSAVVWRADGRGDFTFKGNVKLDRALITDKGEVACLGEQGFVELVSPYGTSGLVSGLTLTWKSIGEVRLQVTLTAASGNYVEVTNGVPLKWGEFTPGNRISWKAALSSGAILSEVKVTYTDISGTRFSFGEPALSGFKARKPIYLKGSSAGTLYHYQVPIKVSRSSLPTTEASVSLRGAGTNSLSLRGAAGAEAISVDGIASGATRPRNDGLAADIYLADAVRGDFADLRFTLSDGETLVDYYREDVIVNDSVTFWLNIPQLPVKGILLYLYYGKPEAGDLSNGQNTFDFYYEFKENFDIIHWSAYSFDEGVLEYKTKNSPEIKTLKIEDVEEDTLLNVSMPTPVLLSASNPSVSLRGRSEATDEAIPVDEIASSPAAPRNDSENTPSRNNQGNTRLGNDSRKDKVIEFFKSGKDFQWARVRKEIAPLPSVDAQKTKESKVEPANVPYFAGLSLDPAGDLVLARDVQQGEYVSEIIKPDFIARIITINYQAQIQAGDSLGVDVSANLDSGFKSEVQGSEYYYAARKDFKEGNSLRFRLRLSSSVSLRASFPSLRGREAAEAIPDEIASLTSFARNDRENIAPRNDREKSRLKEFALDYRPGLISLLSPDGGEKLTQGASYEISWSAWEYEPSYKMKLEYSTDGGKTYNLITKETENSGRYLWSVPSGLVSQRVLVRISDALDSTVYDVSNAVFIIE